MINNTSKTITGAAVILGAAALASRLLGLLRDRVLASSFGAGDVLDAYYAAFRLPDAIYNLLVVGALSAGFIPVFIEYANRKNKKDDHWNLARITITSFLIALVCVSLILILFAPYLMKIIAPGFSLSKIALTTSLSRIMFISPILLGLSSIFGSILQSFRKFVLFATAPLLYNLGIIFGAWLIAPKIGPLGLAWGVVLGAFLHFCLLGFGVRKLGFYFKPQINFSHLGLRRILRLAGPRILTLSVNQIDLFAATIIASTLSVGSLSVYQLANNLQFLPIGIFGISFALAAFPMLSKNAVFGEQDKFIKNFQTTVRQILFFVIPFSILILTLRAQIVRLVLGSGLFDWEDTIQTSDTLAFFSLSIFAQGLVPLFSRAFYAIMDTLTPLLIALVAVFADVVGMLTLTKYFGVSGIALAFSAASILQLGLLWAALRVKIGNLGEQKTVWSLFKITGAVLPMIIAVQISKNFIAPRVDMQTFLGVALQASGALIFGLTVYILAGLLLKNDEAKELVAAVRRLISAKKLPFVAVDETNKP